MGSMVLIAAALAAQDTPPVPGMCTAPASENVGRPGCFLSAELDATGVQAPLFWTIHEFSSRAAADAEARRHRWATVVPTHSRIWLYVLGGRREAVRGGSRAAVIGPLRVPAGKLTARFMESTFPPGMRTRVHAHAGPEAFYVVEGEQCMESPTDKRKVATGATYVIDSGPHIQAAPGGRRNLVLILSPAGAPWITLRPDWTPTTFCDGSSELER